MVWACDWSTGVDHLTDDIHDIEAVALWTEFLAVARKQLAVETLGEFADSDIPEEQILDELDEETLDFASPEGFGVGIRNITRDLWRGSIDLAIFFALGSIILRSGLIGAFNRGAAACGISAGEMTGQELKARDEIVSVNIGFLGGYGEAIVQSARAVGGALAPILSRAEMWTNRWGEAFSEGQMLACRDQKLEWVWNPIKEHCDDCLKYHGRVYRASSWAKVGIYPRSSELQCGGFRCGCRFQETDSPAMPGLPPGPEGG